MKNSINDYVKSKLNTQINITAVYTVHYFKYGRNFNYPGESHNFWELVFIDSGTASIIADDKKLSLSQGEAYFHKPNEYHNISTNDDFANSAIVAFECKSRSLKQLTNRIVKFNDFEKSMLNKIIHEAKQTYNERMNDVYLKKMTKSKNAPFGGEQIIKNCLELLILSVLRNTVNNQHQTEKIGITSSSDTIVENIILILSEMLSSTENISLDEISFRLNFSKSYIKSQFKKKTGYSIIQYYINMKMEKAKKLLSQQKYTVSEIADMLGFSSVYYFSRQFKLNTDMSPSEYVHSIKAENVL